MRVEVECAAFEGAEGKDVLTASYSVPPGYGEGISFLGDQANIAVFCSLDNKKGSVFIKDPEKVVGAYKFEGSEDQGGEEVDTDSRLEIVGEQQLLIFSKKADKSRQILVYLNSENKPNQEVNLQSDVDGASAKPPTIAS